MRIKAADFIEKLKFAEHQKTIYVQGCFGAPMTNANKIRYTKNVLYNKLRASIIKACPSDAFGFDCVNLIKGILWGWEGNLNHIYGGAKYCLDNIPDVNADGLMNLLKDPSDNFKNIQPGEVVWMKGHVGVYVGEGKVIECSPKWTNNVQYSNLANLGYKSGHSRTWKKHGKLPWVTYTDITDSIYHIVAKGETLTKIAKKYNTTLDNIKKLNPDIKDVNKIYVGQKVRVK